jgi:hypothetical protein
MHTPYPIPHPAISLSPCHPLFVFLLVKKEKSRAHTTVSLLCTGAKAPVIFSGMDAVVALLCVQCYLEDSVVIGIREKKVFLYR